MSWHASAIMYFFSQLLWNCYADFIEFRIKTRWPVFAQDAPNPTHSILTILYHGIKIIIAKQSKKILGFEPAGILVAAGMCSLHPAALRNQTK